uniref:Uncharacterized protein n=1 Tax=Eucampia antarctica TaxID=49252 RepID=A0A7S2R6N1_9STRA|eukprot:CAMPEP_0197833430 /NCGR_PEP_ID=MMETSP1437-20131217/19020_1 /TAXON_ID=49252 ORGANISM="Eucampia antarctica, Strain CCMP1452" /NCGR_SAMPLE_ID=MMETSP1437 /ASSEMBLY_ACC=CAM_ASM_001096 /LENGTH=289 /DNA_ID=CAMNT_0043437495 /DNA_START=46 /DNA_END=915 /DNA_ORIENTATION=+
MDVVKRAFSHLKKIEVDIGEDMKSLHNVIEESLEEPEFKVQATAVVIFLCTLYVLRVLIRSRIKMLSGKHIVDLPALNTAILIKEVFLAYLGAALLEPVLTVAGMTDLNAPTVLLECLTFGSICWWIWLVTDAFDCGNVTQQFKYSCELRDEALKDTDKYSWIHIKNASSVRAEERDDLNGNLKIDVALWFMLSCIISAWLPGAVTHADAIHAYAIVLMWSIMHHFCFQATHWGTGYFLSFFFPSSSLLPLEYCLPLMDVADFVENLDTVENYRNFVKDRTGAELIVYS